MEQKEEKSSEDGTTVSPTAEAPGTLGGGASAEEKAKGTAGGTDTEGPPTGAGEQERASAMGKVSAEIQGEGNGLDEGKAEATVESQLPEEDGGKETTAAPQELTDGRAETKSESEEAEGKEETALASEKEKADEKAAKPESREKAGVDDEAKTEPKQVAGEQEAPTASQKESSKTDGPKAEAREKAAAPEVKSDSEKPAPEDTAKAEPQEGDRKEQVVSEAEPRGEEAPHLSGVPCPLGKQPPPPLPLYSLGTSSLPPTDIKSLEQGCSTLVPG